MRYRAFLSYSRADDRAAGWLHRQLDGYRTPRALVGSDGSRGPVPPKLHPVYRDRTDSSGGGQLAQKIEQTLRESAALVVLCSPSAVSSQWVDREVSAFLGHHGEGSVFPVIARDLPETDDVERDFFPPALRGRGLLAADLREIRKENGRLVGDGRETGRLKLIAGLLGADFDQLARRESRRQRRAMIFLAAASIAFAALAAAAIGLGVVARNNSLLAERRAAAMSVDAARNHLSDGRTDAALLVLLEASKTYAREPAPENLLIAFDAALQRAAADSVFELPKGARAFEGPSGAFIADPATGEILLADGNGPPRSIARSGGQPIFVGARIDGAHLVVRSDFKIEEFKPGAAPQVIGEFAPQALPPDWDNDATTISLASNGLLLMQPPFGEEVAEQTVQVFDTLRRERLAVRLSNNYHRYEATTLDGLPIVFDRGQAVSGPGNPAKKNDFADLLIRSCGIEDAAGIQALKKPVEIVMQEHPVGEISCRRRGEAAQLILYEPNSGGGTRIDYIVSPETTSSLAAQLEESVRLGVEPGYLTGDMRGNYFGANPTFSAFDWTTGSIAMAVDRDLVVLHGPPLHDDWGDVLNDRPELRFPSPVAFAQFLPDGRLLVLEAAGGALHVIDHMSSHPYSARRIDAPIAEPPEPLLETERTVCKGKEFSGPSVGGSTLQISVAGSTEDVPAPAVADFRLQRTGAPEQRASFTMKGCVSVSGDGRYVAFETPDSRLQLRDLSLPWEGDRSLAWSTDIKDSVPSPYWTFFGNGPALALADGPTIQLWSPPAEAMPGAAWTNREIYRGVAKVQSFKFDLTGKRMLIMEDLGRFTHGAFIYSLEAGAVFRRLGAEYKWMQADLLASGGILAGDGGGWRYIVRLHDFGGAVAAARSALSPHCRNFPGDKFQSSPCWPSSAAWAGEAAPISSATPR